MKTTLKIKVKCIDYKLTHTLKCTDYKLTYTWITLENWTRDQLAKYIEDKNVLEIKITKK
jgi:hypothetical protein